MDKNIVPLFFYNVNNFSHSLCTFYSFCEFSTFFDITSCIIFLRDAFSQKELFSRIPILNLSTCSAGSAVSVRLWST
uniref:Uncharacterized protein n=1 Tax=Myoviridae sp. ctaUM17 TaxID=2825133 RepID=A0A8S5TWG9_9CAUD|nr:MAG TPA: hypothetical protein [Myoviridae sp. ctaUM17]